MGYLVITPPQTTDLTTVAQVKAELRIGPTTPAPPGWTTAARDAWIADQIATASRAIVDEIDHELVRQRVAERFGGTGRTTTVLDLTPVVAVESLASDWEGTIDLDAASALPARFGIANPDAGILWWDNGWPDDSPIRIGLSPEREPQQGSEPWGVRYLGGYLTRADDIGASGVDVLGTRISLRAGQTAPLLAPGDVIRLTGFTPTNNGRYVVVSREDGAIVVGTSLATETAGPDAAIEVRTLPAALERACLDTVRSWYFGQVRDPAVRSESIGDWSATYGSVAADDMASVLPSTVRRTLEAYTRLM